SPAIVLAFAQHRDPGQAGLRTFENQHLEQHALVVTRSPPLLVMVVDVERIVAAPGTPFVHRQSPRLIQRRALAGPAADCLARRLAGRVASAASTTPTTVSRRMSCNRL